MLNLTGTIRLIAGDVRAVLEVGIFVGHDEVKRSGFEGVEGSSQKGCSNLLSAGSKTGASESGFESREMALEAKVFCGFGEDFQGCFWRCRNPAPFTKNQPLDAPSLFTSARR